MRYLVCVDGSDASDKAFQMAMSLRKPKDEFIIATAITVKEQKTGAEKLLQKYDAQATEKGLKITPMVIEDYDPREAICQAAQSNNVEVIILGTRGLGTIKRMLLGSVSSYVMQHASCDVIVAK